ncbi:glutathione synthetase [Aspergillus steynii IBT 23096]|uniref:Glutathione synthetase n=1 Tax=Aspergillus steynii IBT 23096 TaxID=1392250 RepID=A0A2I2G6V5_9EURO|nr:glutathione synthetase [Aspergillus steynii IBT 23096]PLB48595.1 glutathione synthetase [Aspergillus steynii IBT 23096]
MADLEYPPRVSEERGLSLVSQILDWQINHGSLLKRIDSQSDHSVLTYPLGVAVFPTLFPRRLFDHALHLQSIYNELYCRMAEDEAWIFQAIRDLLPVDAFAATLWGIHEQVKKAGPRGTSLSAGIFRSDYMLQGPNVELRPGCGGNADLCLKQVEFNTFSCAGAAHANKVADMHRYLARTGAYNVENESPNPITLSALPRNTNIESLSACLSAAHAAYGPKRTRRATQTAVLFVVQPDNFNIADERPIEYALGNRDPSIPVYRVDYGDDLLDRTSLTESRELLFYPVDREQPLEISVVYMRAGYEVHEYDETGRQARLRLELSMAVKCPSLLGHICTFKKVQQALTTPEALEHFLPQEKAAMIRSTFVRVYPLDETEAGLHGRSLATDPQVARDYILKPSLEGGGHNVYGDAIPAFLSSIPRSTWCAYILMERIASPGAQNALMSPSGLDMGDVISELGVFGTCLWQKAPDSGSCDILQNTVAGWSFKTKYDDVDEMSVVKGYGCFDTPLLTEHDHGQL